MSTPQPAPAARLDLTWTLGDRLRKIRRQIGLDQVEFAERLGASKPRYVAWETDRNTPQNLVALARRIEVLTGVPAAWTLGVDSPASRPDTPEYMGDIQGDLVLYHHDIDATILTFPQVRRGGGGHADTAVAPALRRMAQ